MQALLKLKNPSAWLHAMLFVDIFGYAVVLPVFATAFFHESEPRFFDDSFATVATYASLFALHSIFLAAGTPFFYKKAERSGTKASLSLSLFLSVIANLATGFALLHHHLLLLLMSRALAGFCSSNATLAAFATRHALSSEQAKRYETSAARANSIGFMTAPLVVGIFADEDLSRFFHFSLPFWIAAFMYLLALLSLPLFVRESKAPVPLPKIRYIAAAVFQRSFASVFALSLFLGTAWFMFVQFFGAYLVTARQVQEAPIGLSLGLIGFFWTLPWFLRVRLSAYHDLLIALLTITIVSASLHCFSELPVLLIGGAIIGFSASLAWQHIPQLFATTDGQTASDLSASFPLFLVCAQVAAATVGALLFQENASWLFVGVAAFAATAALTRAFMRRSV